LLYTRLWNIFHTMRRTIQVVIDPETLREADRGAKSEKVNRSEFIRRAIAHYVEARRREARELRHRSGYERAPVETGEFDVWTTEHAWPED